MTIWTPDPERDEDEPKRAVGGYDAAAGIHFDGWTTDPEVPTYSIREEED